MSCPLVFWQCLYGNYIWIPEKTKTKTLPSLAECVHFRLSQKAINSLISSMILREVYFSTDLPNFSYQL
jgi:hypothetical protein